MRREQGLSLASPVTVALLLGAPIETIGPSGSAAQRARDSQLSARESRTNCANAGTRTRGPWSLGSIRECLKLRQLRGILGDVFAPIPIWPTSALWDVWLVRLRGEIG